MVENMTTILNRLYTTLQHQMQSQLPTSGGVHIYSKDRTIEDFKASKFPNISFNQPYSAYMLGFDKQGAYKGAAGARIPKPRHKGDHPVALERMNFGIIERTTLQSARLIAIPTGGKVVNDL